MLGESVVVVGAGVGGLVSAALLAARGCDVTLCEATSGPGGKLRAVGVDEIDGGPTVFTLRDVFAEIFADCGAAIDDHLTTRRATILARHAWNDDRLDLFADTAASEAAIGAFAGAADARGYRAFRAEAKRIFEALDRPFLRDTSTDPITLGWRMGARGFADYCTLRPYTSLWRALGGYFSDPRLRQLFGRYATYCGSSPFNAPATLMLIAHVEASGVWLIEGGMHRLAAALEALARANGVRFRYGARVDRILIEHGRASGVALADGERIAATSVVCNADPAAIGAGRFGDAARRATAAVPFGRRSLSAMVWTGRARTSGFPLVRHNVFFSGDYAAEFDALRAGRLADAPSVYVCAQDRDAQIPAPVDGERIQIIVNAPPTGDGDPFTPAEIETCTRAMLDRVSRAGLSLDLSRSTVLTTPQGFESLCPSTGGALYGPASHGWAASFRRQGSRTRIPGLYCTGGSTHPRRGRPDGGAFRPTSRRMPARRLPAQGPRFDVAVAPNGYAWWYIDATSDAEGPDGGAYGLTIIGFVGSVFSPYYKLSGRGRPDDHCAINVSLTGPRASAWAMTERPERRVDRSADHFSVGPSAMRWDGDSLVIDIAEISAPLPYKVRGTVRVTPEMIGTTAFALDPAGRHRWHPVAPRARVEVAMTHPGVRWSGAGYFDSNFGDEPLEEGFNDWHWSRAHLKSDVAVLYEGRRRDGTPFDLALRFDRHGRWHDVVQPAPAALPRTGWLVKRATRADAGSTPHVIKTWIDAPFYARSAIATRMFGEDVQAVHESLSLGRLRSPIVQSMLPYRMPRAFW